MYNEILLLHIVLTPGGSRRPLWRLWSYLLYTILPRTLESKNRVKNRAPYSSLHGGSARNFMPRSLRWKKILIFRLFFPIPFYVFVRNSHLFSIINCPLPAHRYSIEGGEETIWMKLHGRMDLRIFELGNGIFTEDPRISRRNPSQPCLMIKKKRPILFGPAHL